MLCPSLGVRTAQVFAVSSVLGSAEGERWQAGPRFSPRHDLPHVRFQKSRGTPSRIERKGFWHNVTEMRPKRRMALILVGSVKATTSIGGWFPLEQKLCTSLDH